MHIIHNKILKFNWKIPITYLIISLSMVKEEVIKSYGLPEIDDWKSGLRLGRFSSVSKWLFTLSYLQLTVKSVAGIHAFFFNAVDNAKG